MAVDDPDGKVGARLWIALAVLAIAAIGIGVVAGAVLINGDNDAPEKVFNALVPVLSTWVGTVLAFYFSKDNFEAANRNVRELVQLTMDERLRKLKVADEMLPIGKATTVSLPAGGSESGVLLSTLRGLFNDRITRIPVLDQNGAMRYVIHSSMVFKYVSDRLDAARGGGAGGGAAFDPATATLADLLAHDKIKERVTAIAWVAMSGTLADAKAAMERTAGCQDVVVTDGGGASEPARGWLTNTRISRLARA